LILPLSPKPAARTAFAARAPVKFARRLSPRFARPALALVEALVDPDEAPLKPEELKS
jgi:hypothetical protein